jgi:RNA polymerase sigma-54 factor
MLIRQVQSVDIRPTTTAHLAQTMSLLELSALELQEKIEAELSTNPALELIEGRFCPTCQRPLIDTLHCPICSRPKTLSNEEPIVFISPREQITSYASWEDDQRISFEETSVECEELPTYVLRQIASELEEADREIAAHILTSLDKDGLLRTPLIEIALYHHVPLSRVEKVQKIIQYADPLGVGSSDPRQALLVQLDVLAQTRAIPPLAKRAIEEGWELLLHHQYAELARNLGVAVTKIKEIATFIGKNLNPYPARANWGEIHQPTAPYREAYYTPDILISLLNGDENAPLVVEIVFPMSGKLRVNPLFREGLREAPAEKLEQWQTVLERATLLVKCIQQRNHAIVRLMQVLVKRQRDFILKGDAYLSPLTRASLAQELEVHESTISRAVSAKTVQLPSGKIIPLAKFFDRSLHIRTELQAIIANESQPLTDMELVEMLRARGYQVARRTVAKYRAMEGILPAHVRSKMRNQKLTLPIV